MVANKHSPSTAMSSLSSRSTSRTATRTVIPPHILTLRTTHSRLRRPSSPLLLSHQLVVSLRPSTVHQSLPHSPQNHTLHLRLLWLSCPPALSASNAWTKQLVSSRFSASTSSTVPVSRSGVAQAAQYAAIHKTMPLPQTAALTARLQTTSAAFADPHKTSGSA